LTARLLQLHACLLHNRLPKAHFVRKHGAELLWAEHVSMRASRPSFASAACVLAILPGDAPLTDDKVREL
jgi:hypothetical protein